MNFNEESLDTQFFLDISNGIFNLPVTPLNPKTIKAENTKIAIIGASYDQGTVCRSGAQFGPEAIRNASEQYNPYLFKYDVNLIDDLGLIDLGNIPVVPGNGEKSHENIYRAAKTIFDLGVVPCFIGGDHSISIPIFRALSDSLDKNKKYGLIYIDSHLDLKDEFAGELNTNWSGVKRWTELPNVDAHNCAFIGIRNSINTYDQIDFVKKNNITMFTADDVVERGIKYCTEAAVEVAASGTNGIYLSLDTDAIDCAYSPGTDGPEPGGLTSRELFLAIDIIGRTNILGFDIVELCPMYDTQAITQRLFFIAMCNIFGALWRSGRFANR